MSVKSLPVTETRRTSTCHKVAPAIHSIAPTMQSVRGDAVFECKPKVSEPESSLSQDSAGVFGGEDSIECAVCLNNARTKMFRPCGHMCVCDDCCESLLAMQSPQCPMCRQYVTEAFKVFL